MVSRITASVVAEFPAPSAGAQLAIEGDPGLYADGNIHLLLFPAEPAAQLFANVGSVTRGNAAAVDVPGGIVQFNGGSTTTLPKRAVGSTPAFEVLFAFGTNGQPASISLQYNAETNILSASEDCHAAVKFAAYKTSAYRLTYAPQLTTLGAGVAQTFGVICAFLPPSSILVHPVQPFSIVDGNAVYELYRIVSPAVTTEQGEFEMPPNYPNDGNYPGLSFTIEPSPSVKTERVHEIGYMDEHGRGWANSFFVPKLEPYVGDPGYTIATSNRIATVEQFPPNLRLKALNHIASRGLGPR